ncbi:hypothetical protein RHSIM_Rhsim13G0219400 [Rhododendron simsii]|uniref:Uncharacterized protein n=1 Tax=Rhododendron simsii TaxID=118357 RepID=A0A834FX13_RHOSS|nr:hypothetical protein RHSIM_Rhsim13G0219400 [Rhododendron simsii]
MDPKLRSPSLHSLISLCKTLAISGIFLYLAFVIFFTTQSYWSASQFYSPVQHIFAASQTTPPPPRGDSPATNISHLVFGLVGSVEAWRHRKAYIESWWRPNVTRGYLYLDTAPTEELLPWSAASPQFRVSDDTSKMALYESRRVAVRIVHAILEVYREGDQGVRWYVMGDDDSIFFVDNWVDVLAKYDHTKYIYIGGQSESLGSDFKYSFEQGFGGAGFALSYPLISAMAKDFEGCLMRYPYLVAADMMTKYCVDELGVPFSAERGIHQIDLHGDISGLLSSHPQAPLMSLHHFDKVAPIFPSMDRFQSTNHLMKSAKVDQSRLLQQTICYHKPTNWSFSISWGYSAHIYEKVIPRTLLKRPLETFRPWSKGLAPPFFPFNTRLHQSFFDPCDAPHVFFMESVENLGGNQIVSTYVRSKTRRLPACSFSGNHSADYISMVRVLSPATKLIQITKSQHNDQQHGPIPTSSCIKGLKRVFLNLAFVIFFTQSYFPASEFYSPVRHIFAASQTTPPPHGNSPTNISHLVFGLVGSLKAWRHRKAYIESWWRPNVTRGYIYLDAAPTKELLPWSAASPQLRVSDDISKIAIKKSRLVPVRIAHAILEVYREGDQGVRWYVMGDDDSIFFVDNWVDVLAKYDHTKYIYIGGHSEMIKSNSLYSFDQGFGGAGFALSYPLIAAMAKDLEGCLMRQSHLVAADLMAQYCVDELGVSLSAERDITVFVEWMHMDLRGDISGFLSSHPQAPLMSLHHFDIVDPIFPSMNRFQSTNHLMKSAKVDQSRLLQQTICYHKPTNWSFSISWGYFAHIYEMVIPKAILKRPLETFKSWHKLWKPPLYMFNTRWPPFKNPCHSPHVFYMKSVNNFGRNQIVSTYVRSAPRGCPTCSFNGNHSADYISKIRVLSPATKLIQVSNKVVE